MESKLLTEDKSIVVPGQAVAEGMEYLPGAGTYRHEEQILVNKLGSLQVDGKVLKIVPLSQTYMPNTNDIVIGKVVDILMSGWRIEINCPYVSVLPLAEASYDFIRKGVDLTEYFDLGEFVVCKITQVTSQNLVDVSMKSNSLKKLKGGVFLNVNAAKIPRVIGRKGSMVSMIKKATDCEIIVGQNGIVWIHGDPKSEVLASNVVKKIAREAHVPGLTDRIKTLLEKETGQELNLDEIQKEAAQEAERDSESSRNSERRGPRGPRRGNGRGPPRGPKRNFKRKDGD